jgi:ADP-heptose:LPS heptosyltransferase
MASQNLKKWLGFLHFNKIPKQIYIGLIGGVGDLVLAAPSIAALKKKYPEAKICFGVGGSIFYDTIANDPNIDTFDTPLFYWPPTKNIRKQLVRKRVEWEKKLRYDLVILLDNPTHDWWKEGKHLIDIYADRCGVTLERRRPLIYLNDDDEAQGEDILERAGIEKGGSFIVLAPETRSSRDIKEWPHQNFVELVQRIHENFSIKIITFVSPNSNRKYPGTVTIKDAPTIRSVAAVIKRAHLYLGLNNGLAHIAGAFEGKIICIHIGFPIEVGGVISPHAVFTSEEPFCDPASIGVDMVFEEVKKALYNV